jgi:hypothetical protein
MLHTDPDSLTAIQPELEPGETVLWAGRPSPGFVFHKSENESLVPFSLIWGGSAIVLGMFALWSLISQPAHLGRSVFLILWCIPFVVIGQYMIWGRFLYAARIKKRTHYAVTDRRVIVVQNHREHQAASADINSLPTLIKENHARGIGTLRFFPALEPFARTWSEMGSNRWDVWDVMSIKYGPIFVDVEAVDSVCQLIAAVQAKATEAAVAGILRNRRSS